MEQGREMWGEAGHSWLESKPRFKVREPNT